ncbi:hypothetical protein P7K49_025007, partial [Saguinus oedipus]
MQVALPRAPVGHTALTCPLGSVSHSTVRPPLEMVIRSYHPAFAAPLPTASLEGTLAP